MAPNRHQKMSATSTSTMTVAERVQALDWDSLRAQVDQHGFAITTALLDGDECDELADLFDGGRFRSTIEMARYRFGHGRYRYFEHPLPDKIAALRSSFYPNLAGSPTMGKRLRGDTEDFRSSTTTCCDAAMLASGGQHR